MGSGALPYSGKAYFSALILSTMLAMLPVAHGRAEASKLLAVRMNAAGVLETLAPDTAEEGSRNFEPGTPLICRWRTPDIDSVEWTLKDRGIIYTRAYRRCWPTGVDERPDRITFTEDLRYTVTEFERAGLYVTDLRGDQWSVPSPSSFDDGLGDESREAFTLSGRSGFFVRYAYHQKSILSPLLDRWKSEIFWFSNPEDVENRQLVLSRGSDRVETVRTLTSADLLLIKRLLARPLQPETEAKKGLPGPLTEDETDPDFERLKLLEQWPWYTYASHVRQVFEQPMDRPQSMPSGSDQPDIQEGDTVEIRNMEPTLFFLVNSKRFGALTPGSEEMMLFPEPDPAIFKDKVMDFQVMDENTLAVLVHSGLYTVSLRSGQHQLRASFPVSHFKSVYPALAISPDRRYAGIMVWTRAHRNEIHVASLEGGKSMKRIAHGEMDMRYVPGIDRTAAFNPNGFNFSPDGLSVVTLWNLKDGQELRVYRVLDGDLAPLPPEKPKEDDTEEPPPPLTDAENTD